MIYCDTSVLIASLTDEEHTAAAAEWLVAQPPGQLVASGWVDAELASGLAIKVRTGQLDSESRARIMQTWRTVRRMSFEVVAIELEDFATATQLLERPDLVLRAGDALHVAVTLRMNCALATLDEGMAKAATLAGLTVCPIATA